MHPRVRQIPPGSSLSMIATLKFGLVWSIASTTYVAEPVPIEIRSYSFIVIPRVDSLNLHDRITMPRLLCVPCNATYLFLGGIRGIIPSPLPTRESGMGPKSCIDCSLQFAYQVKKLTY